VTIDAYEVPVRARQGRPLPPEFGAFHDAGDLLPAIAGGPRMDGKRFAAPLYREPTWRCIATI